MKQVYNFNPAVLPALRQFSSLRNKQLYSIIFQSILCLGTLGFVIYEDLVGMEYFVIKIGNQNEGTLYAYVILLIWLFCIIVRLILNYLEDIPLFSSLQDKMEQKQFEKLKRTYEYQLKLNDKI
ncbi:hypothetical protein [Myroides phaeus]|uniref:Uncharacterized protein n=1 Tax=Myroides phaeus TaxID=702745 RepID=A0A1G8GTP4_9FLAO|nr:hypothetical protein [Myroides phaeus]MEC4117667.1 hypothetical protein [Myroides phaeus]SDH97766.1 hypothetical protein SAMN05421818_13220 [Myroides phaeus]